MNVVKEMTMPQLREVLAAEEQLDIATFDPHAAESPFEGAAAGGMKFHFAGEEYGIRKAAFMHFCKMVGIPTAFAGRVPSLLLAPLFNYYLDTSSWELLSFAHQGGIIEMFSKEGLRPVHNSLVLDAMQQKLGNELQAHHVSSNLLETTFSVVTQEQKPIHVGDMAQLGVTVQNSYALMYPLQVSAYIQRLSCTNGMVSSEVVASFQRRGGKDRSAADWLPEALEQALAAADEELLKVQGLAGIGFNGHLADSLESIYRDFYVPQKVQKIITDRVVSQQPTNAYELMNIITDLASNDPEVLENSQLSTRLMRLGGHIATHSTYCGSCYRILK